MVVGRIASTMEKYTITIRIDREQEEAIRAFFAHQEWTFEEIGKYRGCITGPYVYKLLFKNFKQACVRSVSRLKAYMYNRI